MLGQRESTCRLQSSRTECSCPNFHAALSHEEQLQSSRVFASPGTSFHKCMDPLEVRPSPTLHFLHFLHPPREPGQQGREGCSATASSAFQDDRQWHYGRFCVQHASGTSCTKVAKSKTRPRAACTLRRDSADSRLAVIAARHTLQFKLQRCFL